LNGDLLVETFERVLTLQFLELDRSVLVEELVDGEVASAYSDVDLVLLDLDGDALSAELVDAFSLAHEHDLELLAVGEVVDVLGQSFVDDVALHRDVDSDAGLQVDDVLLEGFNLELCVFELCEESDGCLLRFQVLLFQLIDVFRSVVYFIPELLPGHFTGL